VLFLDEASEVSGTHGPPCMALSGS